MSEPDAEFAPEMEPDEVLLDLEVPTAPADADAFGMTGGENLVKVADGSGDIAIGISGFGSASVSVERWKSLAEATGRTTYALHYDAQELPWARPLESVFDLLDYGPELARRWTAARFAAIGVAEYLANWISRYLEADRKVLVVGFSLGGYVAWRACRTVADPRLEAVLISAAIGDRKDTWKNADKMGHLVNVFSRGDLALQQLYPIVAESDETPAAGLGPILSEATAVTNVDASDLIGWDHLWASDHLDRLIDLAIGCMQKGVPHDVLASGCPAPSCEAVLSLPSYARLLAWTWVLPELCTLMSRAIDGDPEAIGRLERIDAWSIGLASDGEPRLPDLLDAATAVTALSEPAPEGQVAAARSIVELQGWLRLWVRLADPPAINPASMP